METLLQKSIYNSRSKDFYDLYILNKLQLSNIDKNMLIKAFKETCIYRHFAISKDNALLLLNDISVNMQINQRWVNYCRKVKYTGNLLFKDVILTINDWIEIIFE